MQASRHCVKELRCSQGLRSAACFGGVGTVSSMAAAASTASQRAVSWEDCGIHMSSPSAWGGAIDDQQNIMHRQLAAITTVVHAKSLRCWKVSLRLERVSRQKSS